MLDYSVLLKPEDLGPIKLHFNVHGFYTYGNYKFISLNCYMKVMQGRYLAGFVKQSLRLIKKTPNK